MYIIFLNRFPLLFNPYVLLFLVIPCLVVAAQPCWGETQIKKTKVYYILITYFYSEKKVNII